MGPPPGPFSSWLRGVGEQSTPELRIWWWLDRMEGLEGGGLRFFLRFDPAKVGFIGAVSPAALFGRFLGSTTKNGQAITKGGTETAAAAVVSAAALAAAVSVYLAAVHASGRRPSLVRRRRPAAALAGPSSAAARPRALPAPDDGLRILSSKDGSFENVIHGASIGAGDDEPVIIARVETTEADANADGETEHGQSDGKRLEAEQQIRELWLSLVEREQMLELRLQELEDLREQEATARELENRVSAAAVEARLLELKVSSLQEENGRLKAQLEDLDRARAELARAKEKLRAIKARVQEEQEETRREAAVLRSRVAELERGGEETASALAAEALRDANAALEEENMELALRLQDAEQAPSSVHLALEEDIVEEAKQLREANERLTRQIEDLRSDHCAQVEELVYLKWVNACLRHELGDHGLHDADDGSGGMSALELSKSMSYRSSERAKQLMFQYGHHGLDPALFSPLHESVEGDGARNYVEPARSPAGTSVTTITAAKKSGPRNKLKFLGNFKKLLPGSGSKRSHSSHGGSRENSSRPPAPSDEYLEKAMQWLSTHDVLDFDHSYESTPLSSCDRTPPSSVTTATARGGERGPAVTHEEAAGPARLQRSKSEGGKSYGREARRYHSLRPDHPADEAQIAPQKWNRSRRRRSEEQRSPGAAREE